MLNLKQRAAWTIGLACLLAACSEQSRVPDGGSVGPRPALPEPTQTLLPTVNIAPAQGWAEGAQPTPAPGLQVGALASGLSHPRWLYVLPNGDVLVAETNAPERPEDGTGIKGWVMKKVMARAGARVPSPNRITLLRDADGDGRAEVKSAFLENLNSPFGMALVGDKLYVANTDAVMEYDYSPGQTRIGGAGKRLTDLPGGPINHHWTKALIASPDGSKLYATVGSNSNVAENGIDKEAGRAAIWEIDRVGSTKGTKRLYATGLRNPNGMAFTPDGALWTVVNERDELGSDLVPDYLTSVRQGAFYGWPFSWWGQHVDERVKPPQPEQVARAVVPDYALGTHVAPLGLAAVAAGNALPALLGGTAAASRVSGTAAAAAAAAASAPPAGMFVGLHGSWNRKPRSGYKVVFVPFEGMRPREAPPVDVLTGFVSPGGDAFGRPVGVAIDARGALLVADDVGNTVWRVTAR
jgi:glucose/arabinose dehydrogenase